MADRQSRYVKLTKDKEQAPFQDITPGELNQPIEVPQLNVRRCIECGQVLPETYQPPADEDWTTGICGCVEDIDSCCTGLFCPCVLFGRNLEAMRDDISWTEGCVCHAMCVEGGMALAVATTLFNGIDPQTAFLIGEGLFFTWWMCGIYTGLFRQTLQKKYHLKERAYMMLRMNNDGSDYGSWEGGSYLHDDGDDFDDLHDGTDVDEDDDDEDEDDDNVEEYEDEDAFDVHARASVGEHDNPILEFDPNVFSSDEAYARALQEAEEREMAARLFALAGLNDLTEETEDMEEHGANSQDAWEDVDPDELSYEELLALGEVVGTESRGLSTDTIACLPSVNYKTGSDQHGSNDSCVICRVDYEDDESLTVLSCKHLYHPECINNWLKINKVCPVCSTEVSASGSNL